MTKELTYKRIEYFGSLDNEKLESLIIRFQSLVYKYGDTTCLEEDDGCFEIYHWREETDAEENKRIGDSKAHTINKEARDRKLLAELKAKYGE